MLKLKSLSLKLSLPPKLSLPSFFATWQGKLKVKNCHRLIFAITKEAIYIFNLKEIADQQWETIDYIHCLIHDDDPLFAEEIVYNQLRNNPFPADLQLLFSQDFAIAKDCLFPQLSSKELHKALKWEIKNLPPENYYTYLVKNSPDSCEVKILGLPYHLIKKWTKIFKDNNRSLHKIHLTNTQDQDFHTNLKIPKGMLPEELSILWHNNLQICLSADYSLLPNTYRAVTYQWHKIINYLLSTCLIITALCLGLGYFSLHNLQQENNRLNSQAELIQGDLKLAAQIKTLEKTLTAKEDLAATLNKENIGFYALIQQISLIDVPGVALTKIKISEQGITLEGQALNYTLLNEYKEKLPTMPLLAKLQLLTSQRDTQNNYINFIFQGELPND